MKPLNLYGNREKRGSAAEVDYLVPFEGQVLPVEVKAGKTGTLRSLHVFLQEKGASPPDSLSPALHGCAMAQTARRKIIKDFLVW